MNLWSSAAFDQLEPHHGAVSWTPIYSAIYSQTAKSWVSTSKLREYLDSDANKYLERAEKDVKLMDDNGELRRKLIREGVLVSCIRPLDEVQAEPRNGPVETTRRTTQNSTLSLNRIGITETTYNVAYREKSLNNSEYIWMRSGKPCIEISREELLALSLTLGITLYINDFTQNVRGLGPFGTGLNIVQDNGEWKLEMVHGARLPRHRASKGSGYTPLFAKHIAFGSLPFADAKNWVRSVFVNDGVLEAIKRGDSIIDGRSFGGRPLQILKRLPGSKSIDAYYHWSSADKLNLQPGFKHRLGHFYDTTKTIPVMMRPQKGAAGTSTKSPVYSSPSTLPNNAEGKDAAIEMAKLEEQDENLANWTRTVTGIAFGGLVPQSSSNLAQAVQFHRRGNSQAIQSTRRSCESKRGRRSDKCNRGPSQPNPDLGQPTCALTRTSRRKGI
jgi:hypothetical protein